jgi:hypothetical protein
MKESKKPQLRASPGEKILTLHPQGKRGVHIAKDKYDVMRTAILGALKGRTELTHTELFQAVEKLLPRGFKGSTMWCFETTKLDLEGRRLIERLTDTDPHHYRLEK